jgi:hypothetical protein
VKIPASKGKIIARVFVAGLTFVRWMKNGNRRKIEKTILYNAVTGPGAVAQRTNIAEKLSASIPTPNAR